MSLATAVNALKFLPLFHNTSLRLLTDLVDLADEAADIDDHYDKELQETALVAVEHGIVRIAIDAEDEGRIVDRRYPVGSAFVADKVNLGPRTMRARAIGKSARVRRFRKDTLAERVQSSPSLMRSLDGAVVEKLMQRNGCARPQLHMVWMTATSKVGAPLEALTFLLGAAIAKQFAKESVAVGVLRNDALELSVWDGRGFGRIECPPVDRDHEEHIASLIDAKGATFVHLLLAHPAAPYDLPARFRDLRCHRIVELTRQLPTKPPAAFADLLRPDIRNVSGNGTPYFSSFVPTVLMPTNGARRRGPDTEAYDDSFDWLSADVARRLRRDSCRLKLDTETIAERWRGYGKASRELVDVVFGDAALARSLFRWARAMTNRRVGVALSGGGASAYRMVPFLRGLEGEGVPVDVVSGVSGGALLGAYYCAGGLQGLDRCTARGLLFELCTLVAAINTTPFQQTIDTDLDAVTVEELEVPLVAVTTALAHGKPPEPRVVIRGTLGEAVRRSGSLPIFFAPSGTPATRFADGATSALVPARPLRDFGADMVIACNCVPGAKERNPFAAWPYPAAPIGELLYRFTPVGRVVDLWVSAASLLERLSREAADDAHVYVEALPAQEPLVESLRFDRAATIVESAKEEMTAHVETCRRRWQDFIA